MTEEYKDQDTLDPEGDEDTLEPQGDESNEELAKLKEIAENQKIRAEKAERELKEMKEVKPQETPRENILSQSDMIALIKEDIEDDGLIDEVKTFAKLKNITVKEALKSSVMRAVIAERKYSPSCAHSQIHPALPAVSSPVLPLRTVQTYNQPSRYQYSLPHQAYLILFAILPDIPLLFRRYFYIPRILF